MGLDQTPYGSSRIGQEQIGEIIASNDLNLVNINTATQNIIGDKYFEMSNHLGNVLEVVSDRKLPVNDGNGNIDYFLADVVSYSDYYPYGMQMPGRKQLRDLDANGNPVYVPANGSDGYRYGFGGQEKDNEIAGNGNSYTAEFWQYDPRLGRRWNIDPVVKEHESPYAAFGNNPIWFMDPNGADTVVSVYQDAQNVGGVDVTVYHADKTEQTPGALIFNVYNKQGDLIETYEGIKNEDNPNGLDLNSHIGAKLLKNITAYSKDSEDIRRTKHEEGYLYKYINPEGNRYKYSSDPNLNSFIGGTLWVGIDVQINFKMDKTGVNESEMENYSQGIANLNNVINLINNNSLTLSSPLPNSNRQVTFNFLNSPVTVYGYHSPEHSNYVPAQGSPAHRSELTGNAALDINRAFNTMVYVRRNLDKAMGRVPMNYRSGGESDERKATFFIKL